MPVKTTKPAKAVDFNNDFATDTIRLRGHDFVFKELTIAAYDELVKLATMTGDGADYIDNNLLNKLLVVASCESPKLTDESFAEMGVRMGRKLQSVAIRLNYGDEPEDKEEEKDEGPDIQEGEPEEEGEG